MAPAKSSAIIYHHRIRHRSSQRQVVGALSNNLPTTQDPGIIVLGLAISLSTTRWSYNHSCPLRRSHIPQLDSSGLSCEKHDLNDNSDWNTRSVTLPKQYLWPSKVFPLHVISSAGRILGLTFAFTSLGRRLTALFLNRRPTRICHLGAID